MSALPHDLAITVIAVIAVCFVVLGIFYNFIAYHLGLEEGAPAHRFYSLLIGLMLFALLWVYRLARSSM